MAKDPKAPTAAGATSAAAGRAPTTGRGRFARGGAAKGSTAKGSTANGSTAKGGAGKGPREKKPRFEKAKQFIAAYRLSRQRDPRLPWYMVLAGAGVFAVVLLLLTLLGVNLVLTVPVALLLGVLATMTVFGRRAQKAAFTEVEGQPGAAAWVLQTMRGDWRITQGVAMNAQLDAVHRVLGRPGIMLVAEGAPQRVRGLLAQEKKRVARVAGDTPIYDIVLGEEEGQIALRRLSNHVAKLPRNLSPGQVNAVEKRLAALGGTRSAPLPKGPMPKGARLSGMERTLRRR